MTELAQLATTTINTRARRRLQMAGDTIVEVLICVLLVSVVLGGAYTTVHRSTVGIRNSQEHAEALKRLQAQVEQIRTNASSTNATVFTTTPAFCMIDGNVVLLTQLPAANNCNQDGSGQASTTPPYYKLSVKRTLVAGNQQLFTVRADWDAITGGPAQETIFYRLQQ